MFRLRPASSVPLPFSEHPRRSVRIAGGPCVATAHARKRHCVTPVPTARTTRNTPLPLRMTPRRPATPARALQRPIRTHPGPHPPRIFRRAIRLGRSSIFRRAIRLGRMIPKLSPKKLRFSTLLPHLPKIIFLGIKFSALAISLFRNFIVL